MSVVIMGHVVFLIFTQKTVVENITKAGVSDLVMADQVFVASNDIDKRGNSTG
jgi:hypothetical protein